jgi:hypothetical protein
MTDSPLPKRYVDIELIGEGGFGRVYRAHDTNLDRAVAAKVAKERRDESQDLDAFITEARRSAGLQHPNIVAVHDLEFHEDHLFLTMEYAPNGTLEDLLASGTPDAALAIRFIQQAAAGLQHAHSRGFVHRDVKPSNLLLDAHDTVKVGDFGLAREFDRSTTHFGGTPRYAAPEQFNEGKNLNAAADVFGLAVTSYELLTGERHGGFSSLASGDYPPPPSDLVPDLSPAVDDVLGRALELNRYDRTQSVMTFAEELRAAFEHEPSRPTIQKARAPKPRPVPAQLDLTSEVPPPPARPDGGPAPAFECFMGVKWSGAAATKDAAKSIWVAVVREGRLEELKTGIGRGDATKLIDIARQNDEPALAGIDFGFSVPRWYLESHGMSSGPELWASMSDLQAKLGPETQWPRALDEPFWGPLIRTRPELTPGRSWFRSTEETARALTGAVPKSVFQLSGAGSVGGQSVRGMPQLQDLRNQGWRIWPFDPAGRHTIVEVFPRALWQALADPSHHASTDEIRDALVDDLCRGLQVDDPADRAALRSEHSAFEAAFSAWHLSNASAPLPDLTSDPVARLEGRIWLPA